MDKDKAAATPPTPLDPGLPWLVHYGGDILYADLHPVAGHPGNIQEIEIGLEHVRASDGIRVAYDFERDGYVIKQPRRAIVPIDDHTAEERIEWVETAFVQSWALEGEGEG